MIKWFKELFAELTGATAEARNIRETLAEANAKLREGFGLDPAPARMIEGRKERKQ